MNCKNGSINEKSLNPDINRSDDNPNNNLIFQNDDAQYDIQRHNTQINENTKQINYTSNDQLINQNFSNDNFNDRRNEFMQRKSYRNQKNFNLEREEQLSDNQILIKLNNLKMRLNSTLNKLPYRWQVYK